MNTPRPTLFDPRSPYSVMRSSFPPEDKLRGFFLSLAARQERGMIARGPQGALNPKTLFLNAWDCEQDIAAACHLDLHATRDRDAELSIRLGQWKRDTLFRDQPYPCRVFLIEPEALAHLASTVRQADGDGDEARRLRNLFDDNIIRSNLELSRVLSALPEMDGQVDVFGDQVLREAVTAGELVLPENTWLVAVLDTTPIAGETFEKDRIRRGLQEPAQMHRTSPAPVEPRAAGGRLSRLTITIAEGAFSEVRNGRTMSTSSPRSDRLSGWDVEATFGSSRVHMGAADPAGVLDAGQPRQRHRMGLEFHRDLPDGLGVFALSLNIDASGSVTCTAEMKRSAASPTRIVKIIIIFQGAPIIRLSAQQSAKIHPLPSIDALRDSSLKISIEVDGEVAESLAIDIRR